MRIELQTSPSSSVLLLDNVSHLQAFEVRHCLNPHAKKKKVVYYPDVVKYLIFVQSAKVGTVNGNR